MREAHAHIAAYGQSLTIPSLASCASLAECLDTIRAAALPVSKGVSGGATRPTTSWLRFHSARIEGWPERRWPTLAELDRAAPDRPCIVLSFDHHAAAANSAALRAADLKPGQRVPPSGLVCVDPTSGRATGLLLEHAAYRAWESAPAPTSAERRTHILTALRALADLGYSEVHDLHAQPWLGQALADIERAGQLPVKQVRLYPPIADLAAAHAGRAAWESPTLRLAGGKVFSDGTLNSRTALMLHPYREPLNNQPRGHAMVTERDLDDAVRLSESLGLHVAVHAIGDAAVRMVLDSIERAGSIREMKPGNRHRIEHAELIDPADVTRFAKLGVVCSVQPCHLLADIEVLTSQLPHRLDRVFPLRELIDSGCTPGGDDALLWFGSDVPIVRADPEDSIQAATQRRRPTEPASAAITPAQSISPTEARAAFG